jgi:hypothetical protein
VGENYRCRTFKIFSEIDEEYIEFVNPAIEKRFINNSGSNPIFLMNILLK